MVCARNDRLPLSHEQNNAWRLITPLVNSRTVNVVVRSASELNQPLLHFVNPVSMFGKHISAWSDIWCLVVNWVKVLASGRPEIERDKVWRLFKITLFFVTTLTLITLQGSVHKYVMWSELFQCQIAKLSLMLCANFNGNLSTT